MVAFMPRESVMDVRRCARCEALYAYRPVLNTGRLCSACAGNDPVTQLQAERRQQQAIARSARRKHHGGAFKARKEDPEAPSLSSVAIVNGRLVYTWEGPAHF